MSAKTVLPQVFAEIDLNYYLDLVRDENGVMESVCYSQGKEFSPDKKTVFIIKSDLLGGELKGLGTKLLLELFHSAIRSKIKPGAIILLSSAVTLADKEPFFSRLLTLEEQGVKIMVCVSSADHYGIMDSIKAGFLVSMDEIYNVIMSAGKIISL